MPNENHADDKFDPCRDCTSHKAVTGTQRVILWLLGGVGVLFLAGFSSFVVLSSTVSAGEQAQKAIIKSLEDIQEAQKEIRKEIMEGHKIQQKIASNVEKQGIIIDMRYNDISRQLKENLEQSLRNKDHINGILERERERINHAD